MTRRLTLSSAGLKSPLDVTAPPPTPATDHDAPLDAPPSPQPTHVEDRPLRRHRSTPAALTVAEAPQPPPDRFYATGRPVQTSLALDADCATRLVELARGGRVAVNPLAVAAIHAGLPNDADTVRSLIVTERVARAGDPKARVEHNLRLPERLRARVDELVDAVREQIPRATRADLINATLRAGLPGDAHAAARLVRTHAQQLERSHGQA